MTSAMQIPDPPSAPDQSGEPVFREPWEARIFAIVLSLHDQRAFEWAAFQELLIDEIRRGELAGEERDYYENWFAAAERLIVNLDIAQMKEIDTEVGRLRPDDKTVVLPKT